MSTLLSQTAEYALRVMAYVAVQADHAPLSGKEIASRTHVPASYQSKIVRKLVVAGLLESQRGQQGGVSLAKDPAKISIADVLEAIGEPVERSRCAFGWGKCNSAEPCPLHPIWSQMSEAYVDWAQRRTLADLRRAWFGFGHWHDGTGRRGA